MIEALGWGALAASSLMIGAALALLRRWQPSTVGLVLGFGAGALISAVSFELAQEGAETGGTAAVGIGFGFGAAAFYLLDGVVSGRAGRDGRDAAGSSLALGAFLDGVPEQLVLGLGLAHGDGVSVGLLGAVFVSNLPEAIGASSDMSDAKKSRGQILRLWGAVALVCALASGAGFGVGDAVSGELEGGVDGFAAGALLVMLADSMIPEARSKAKRRAGLATALGFAIAAALSGIS